MRMSNVPSAAPGASSCLTPGGRLGLPWRCPRESGHKHKAGGSLQDVPGRMQESQYSRKIQKGLQDQTQQHD